MQRLHRAIERDLEAARASPGSVDEKLSANPNQRFEKWTMLRKELSKEFLPLVKSLVKAGLLVTGVEFEDDFKSTEMEYAWVAGSPDEAWVDENGICLVARVEEGSDAPFRSPTRTRVF